MDISIDDPSVPIGYIKLEEGGSESGQVWGKPAEGRYVESITAQRPLTVAASWCSQYTSEWGGGDTG